MNAKRSKELLIQIVNNRSARAPEAVFPTEAQIQRECQLIQSKWDEREKTLRRMRARMACQFGICRNF